MQRFFGFAVLVLFALLLLTGLLDWMGGCGVGSPLIHRYQSVSSGFSNTVTSARMTSDRSCGSGTRENSSTSALPPNAPRDPETLRICFW